jgi:hypothetical protein
MDNIVSNSSGLTASHLRAAHHHVGNSQSESIMQSQHAKAIFISSATTALLLTVSCGILLHNDIHIVCTLVLTQPPHLWPKLQLALCHQLHPTDDNGGLSPLEVLGCS